MRAGTAEDYMLDPLNSLFHSRQQQAQPARPAEANMPEAKVHKHLAWTLNTGPASPASWPEAQSHQQPCH